MADTSFWAETDGADETFGYDEAYTWDDAEDASLFISSWTEYEGVISGLSDAPTASFIMGNRIYFIEGANFVYYDGAESGPVTEIAYIPTVSLGKKPDGTGGTPNEVFNRISQFWKESFDPDGTETEFHCDIIYQTDGVTPVTLSDNLFKAYLYEEELIEDTDFTFDRETWVATFDAAPGYVNDVDTLQIQLEATDLMDTTVIAGCTIAIEHGGKNNSVVLLTGNPAYPNTVYYSWVYNPTYWPEDYDFNVGGDALPVTGLGRMNEYLISYKKPGDQSLQWYSEIDVDTDGDIFYNTYQLNDQYGCIAPRTVHPAQNGLLALSDQGVIWTWPELLQGHYNSKIVSRNINGKNGIAEGLLDNTVADLEGAFAVIHNNKYMLHVGDKVWILDLDYSDLGQNIFCWYPYAGLYENASAFLNKEGRLYVGDEATGLIYMSQLATDDTYHNDDGVAIDAWWKCPLLFLGGRDWEKKFERLNLSFKASYGTTHSLTFYSDAGSEVISLRQEAGRFDARYFHAEYFNAGSFAPDFPTAQSEKIGIKGEYFSFMIRNNMLDRGMTLLAAVVTYLPRKRIK